jgi:hypothetical protein
MPRLSTESGGKYGTCDVLRGTELLQAIGTAGTDAESGDILSRILINPSNFNNTRLNQFAPLYQRYRFRKLLFLYEPVCPATTQGQLIGFGDYDVDNLITEDTPTNINIAAAHFGQEVCQVWEARAFPFGVVDDFTTLFCRISDAEARLIYQGVYYLFAASDIAADTACGNLYIDYEIEFYVPQLDASVAEQIWALQLESDSDPTMTNWWGASMHVADMPSPYPATNLSWSLDGSGGLVVSGVPPGVYTFTASIPMMVAGDQIDANTYNVNLTASTGFTANALSYSSVTQNATEALANMTYMVWAGFEVPVGDGQIVIKPAMTKSGSLSPTFVGS